MAEMIIDHPSMPITLTWEELNESYDTLADLGVDLEFVQEFEYIDPGEPRPRFIDASGDRYRILVISLEVVFCVRIPSEFDPLDLELVSTNLDGNDIVIEHLEGRIHRALAATPNGQGVYAAVRDAGFPPLDSLSRLEQLGEAPMTWVEFDQRWFESIDPAPPMAIPEAIRATITSIRGRWRNRRTK